MYPWYYVHMKRKNRTSFGFTLVEVMVVVGIIAVLASAVVGSYESAKKKSRDTVRVSDISNLQVAFKIYRQTATADNELPHGGGYDSGMVIGVGNAIDTDLGPYIATIPKDPTNDSDHQYVYDSDFDTCTVSGIGPNKKILYATNMERSGQGNWAEVCGGPAPGSDTYVVILQ